MVIGNGEPVLIGLEHLRALKYACWRQGLTDSQVEDIFFNNLERRESEATAWDRN